VKHTPRYHNQDDEDDLEYAFAVGDKKQEKIEITVRGLS